MFTANDVHLLAQKALIIMMMWYVYFYCWDEDLVQFLYTLLELVTSLSAQSWFVTMNTASFLSCTAATAMISSILVHGLAYM